LFDGAEDGAAPFAVPADRGGGDGIPRLTCMLAEKSARVTQGGGGEAALIVKNEGTGGLIVRMIATQHAWLNVRPLELPLTIPPGEARQVAFAISAARLTPGDYRSEVYLSANATAKTAEDLRGGWFKHTAEIRITVEGGAALSTRAADGPVGGAGRRETAVSRRRAPRRRGHGLPAGLSRVAPRGVARGRGGARPRKTMRMANKTTPPMRFVAALFWLAAVAWAAAAGGPSRAQDAGGGIPEDLGEAKQAVQDLRAVKNKTLIFVFDVSGSMAGQNLARAREATITLLREATATGDRLVLLTFGAGYQTVFDQTLAAEADKDALIEQVPSAPAVGRRHQHPQAAPRRAQDPRPEPAAPGAVVLLTDSLNDEP
jgi:hypothetical protein